MAIRRKLLQHLELLLLDPKPSTSLWLQPSSSLAQACFYNIVLARVLCGAGTLLHGVLELLQPLLTTSTHPSHLLTTLSDPAQPEDHTAYC